MAKPIGSGTTNGAPLTQVVRYGRIHKRKPPDQSCRSNKGLCVSPPGFRLCRMCEKQLPLDQFYEGTRRFVCKYHHYQMVLRTTKKRFSECEYEKLAWTSWMDLYVFAPILGYKNVNYDRHDILDIMKTAKIPVLCKPRAVPIDPRQPLYPRNVAVVSMRHKALLLRLFQETASVAQYILLVQSCNLLPENADVGRPRDLFHDPNYKRPYVDVRPLLEDEPHNVRPMVEAVFAAAAALENGASIKGESWLRMPSRRKPPSPADEEESTPPPATSKQPSPPATSKQPSTPATSPPATSKQPSPPATSKQPSPPATTTGGRVKKCARILNLRSRLAGDNSL